MNAPKDHSRYTIRFRWPVIATLTLLVAGCGNSDRQKLVGSWELKDFERVESAVTDVADLDAQSKMAIHFQSDGTLVTQTGIGNIQREKTGTWKFLGFKEAISVVRIECVLGNQKTEHNVQILAGDQIKLAPPNMAGLSMQLEFRRQE